LELRERAAALGGELQVERGLASGTSVRVKIPATTLSTLKKKKAAPPNSKAD